MSVLNLVLLVLLASSTAQAGIPRYVQGQWVITEENPQNEDTDGPFPTVRERIGLQSPPEVVELVVVEDQNLLNTAEPYALTEEDPDDDDDDDEDDSEVWKIVLVVSILLLSVVGSLSVAYYMCVWRGGRINYQPQKVDYA